MKELQILNKVGWIGYYLGQEITLEVKKFNSHTKKVKEINHKKNFLLKKE